MPNQADFESRVNSAESDILWGAVAIGRAIGRTKSQTNYLLERDLLKSARKVGEKWVASRSALLRELGGAQ